MMNSFIRAKRPDCSECKIDLIALEDALDSDIGGTRYFNPQSGEIIFSEDPDEDPDELDIEGHLPIDTISSRTRFRWMEDFIGTVYSITAQSALRRALTQNKPFRHFKDALTEYPAVRQQWFTFENQQLLRAALSFIEEFDWEIIEVVDGRTQPKPDVEDVELAARLAPTEEEHDWILRGASEISAKGGRAQLALLLKGSKDKKVLKHKLNESPAYGKLSFLTIEEIENRIDQLIRRSELLVQFFGDLPLVLLSDSAWDHVRAWSHEQQWRRAAAANDRGLQEILLEWRNRPRSEQVLLLDVAGVLDSQSAKRLLMAWSAVAGREMRARIEERMSLFEL